jgi:hypothetical protein
LRALLLYIFTAFHNPPSAELQGLLFKIQFPACGFSGEFRTDKTHLKKIVQSYTRAQLGESNHMCGKMNTFPEGLSILVAFCLF